MDAIDFGAAGFALAMGLSATGSALGTGAAGMAAVGAWKKCLLEGKAPPFLLVAFVGAPLSHTIYGMILMNAIQTAPDTVSSITKFSAGLMGGLAMGASSWFQGKAGTLASDALAETGKGFGNYIMVLGVIETVALFVMVFLMTVLR